MQRVIPGGCRSNWFDWLRPVNLAIYTMAFGVFGLSSCSRERSEGHNEPGNDLKLGKQGLCVADRTVSKRLTAGKPESIDPSKFGADPTGNLDAGPILQAILSSARSGSTVQIAAGATFRHHCGLSITAGGLTISGSGTLLAGNEASSAINVNAANTHIQQITIEGFSSSRRWTSPWQSSLVLDGADASSVQDVKIKGAGSAGVLVRRTQRFRMSNLDVSDTRADGLHITDGASDGKIESVKVRRSGDDGVAIVSYANNQRPVQSITLSGIDVADQLKGRGITVAGGRQIKVKNFQLKRTQGAGLLIGSSRGWETSTTSDVTVEHGSIEEANLDGGVDHGAIFISSEQEAQPISNVSLSDLKVINTRPSASAQIRIINPFAALSSVFFDGLSFSGGPARLVFTQGSTEGITLKNVVRVN